MKTLSSAQDLRQVRSEWTGQVGFVPTMGALHAGHYSLCARARRENKIVVASIFVNPTQFNDPHDLKKYPRTLEQDLEGLQLAEVDYVFLPRAEDMYADNYQFEIREKTSSQMLCGAHRPGHFEGVLTVVMKLFNLVKPHRAYFGEKDYQQLMLIQDMVKAFFMDIEVVPCKTLRETDGLAMSSRNMRLEASERKIAPRLYSVLKNASTTEQARHELEQAGFRVDYIEELWGRRFGAAFLGSTRLIDNVEI